MRRVCSIVLYVIAGFVLCMAISVAFIRPDHDVWIKWLVMGVFLACALVTQCIGLALHRFRNWRRDSGIVLLSSAGYAAFGIFTIGCILMDKESRAIMKTDSMPFFGDWFTGSVFIVLLAVEGWLLFRSAAEEALPDDPAPSPPAPSLSN